MNPLVTASLVVSLAIVAARVLPGRPDPGPQDAQADRGADDSVVPGWVQWHADLEEAKASAAISGKPVLVFQLLGRLDERLC